MKRFIWPGMVFALIGMNMVVVVITVLASRHDSSFALVPAFDSKAMHFQEELDRRAASVDLGWTVAPIFTRTADQSVHAAFELRDREGAPITNATFSVSLFHHAHATRRIDTRGVESAPGFYSVDVKLAPCGLWRFEITAQRGDDHFEATMDQTIGGPT